jgi:hypothetical protein
MDLGRRMDQDLYDRQNAYPIILGAGLTGLAISRALSVAEIPHVLVGDGPTEMPRLGESLNAEGSLEIMRQFPDLARFFFDKRRLALFFGGHALSFDSIQYAAGHTYYPLLSYPSTVQLRHVDRVGFDRALFATATASKYCIHISDKIVALDYKPVSDRIAAVILASGKTITSTYVFDATNQACFVARKLGVGLRRIGEARRVVFAILPIARMAHRHICTLVTTWCTDLHVVRFPDPEYAAFTQAVLFGVKRARGERNAMAAGALAGQIMSAPSLSQKPERTYRVPRLSSAWELTALEIDPYAACALVRAQSPLWQTPEAQDYFTDTQSHECHPLLPPRKAHVATLAAAGLLNNAIIDGPDGPLVLKGSIRKQFRVDAERSSEEKLVEREQLQITMKVIDRTGVITTLQ